MNFNTHTILFTLIYQDEEYPVQTYINEYYSLMTLISDHLPIVGFGLCCGMGSCGTCMVNIQEKNSSIKRVTLSCGVSINDELANTKITIQDAVY